MSQEEHKYTLTAIDTSGIQPYIFGSNVLQHNIGASYLVKWATEEAVCEILNQLSIIQHTNLQQDYSIDSSKRMENGNLDAELVYSGGGNTFLLFRSKEMARQFAQTHSKEVMKKAPGLRVVITHESVQWDPDNANQSDVLADKIDAIIQTLNLKKRDGALQSAPLLGLGVTADCQFTGMPAIGEIPRSRKGRGANKLQRASAEVVMKSKAIANANKRLEKEVEFAKAEQFIYDFDDIGTKDEFSFLAVVHIDGNGMGNRVKKIADKYRSAGHNRSYIESMREFSDSIHQASKGALQSTVQSLQDAIDEEGKIGGKVQIDRGVIPFRPIVFGGDDATFVCDGRLGLSLAHYYMNALMEHVLSDGQPLSVRGGVAIVKTHYPFSRSYELAEQLAKSAKTFLHSYRKANETAELPPCAIDWHFASTGLVLELDEVRKREFQDGNLLMRPLLLQDDYVPNEWRTWTQFENAMKHFQENWLDKDKRSKLKGLRTALRNGGDAVQQFMLFYEPENTLPPVAGRGETEKTGWVGNERCTSFDAIEALDFFVQLRSQLEI